MATTTTKVIATISLPLRVQVSNTDSIQCGEKISIQKIRQGGNKMMTEKKKIV